MNSSTTRKCRLALTDVNPLSFQRLEDRQLLAAVTVNNATDLTNADTSSITALIADDGGDGISLREAITASNNTAGEDTITFDGGVFTGGANSLIRLTQGELEITDDLTVDGSGGNDIVITADANGDDITVAGTFITDVAASFGGTAGDTNDLLDDNSRVINFSVPGEGALNLANLTVTGGRTVDASSGGGGIIIGRDNQQIVSLSLDNTVVSGNSTTGDFSHGGGIFAGRSFEEFQISLTNSVISGNSTSGRRSFGGGITTSGSVYLTNSSVTGNNTSGDGSRGGGIYAGAATYGDIRPDSIVVGLTNSTVSENSTSGDGARGGGIHTNAAFLRLTNSEVSGNSTAGDDSGGGGIGSTSTSITLLNSVVSGNSTIGDESDGGGIRIYYLRLDSIYPFVGLTNSTVSGNSTSGNRSEGGGISGNNYLVELTNSSVSGNSTSGEDSGGGGIANPTGRVSVANSTVSGNSTSGDRSDGGGISGPFSLLLTNSTLSRNSISGEDASGGGIHATSVRLRNSTITGNSSEGEGGGIGIARSIFNFDPYGDLESFNSIIAGNFDNGTAPDLLAPSDVIDDLIVEHSLIGDTTGSGVTATTGTGNILDQPAMLGPLADFGGPTLTHALLPGSLAIDAGNNSLAVDPIDFSEDVPFTTDQRGIGFNRIEFGTVDVGAFESTGGTLLPPPVIVSVTINEGGVLVRPDLWNTLTVVFDADVTVAAGDLSLVNDSSGGIAVDLTGIRFSYDSTTHTAIWDFSTLDPLDAGFYTWHLNTNAGSDDFVGQHYVAIPGDANLDGRVDVLGDAFALVANLGSTTNLAFTDGNFNGDGVVDVLGDAFILVANLGQDVIPPTSITVTNATDVTNADTSSIAALIANDGGDGISLREAIEATNNTAGLDTITFDGGVFIGGINSLIRLTQGELEITDDLTIDGSSGTEIVITGDANGDDVTVPGTFITDVGASFGVTGGFDNSRVINFSVPSEGILNLTNLTVTGGRTTIDRATGGGINTLSGDIFISNSTISGNSTSGFVSRGGGISTVSGDISLTNSTISGNSTSGRSSNGGGIRTLSGAISLTNSTVRGNSSSGQSSSGGGISTPFGSISLNGSELTGNVASGGGGGISATDASVSLINSTLRDNSADFGGGISIRSLYGSASLTLTGSTISGNSGRAGGGGIYAISTSVALTGSTVSGNSSSGSLARGGGIRLRNGSASLINSTVTGNVTSGVGGGINFSNNNQPAANRLTIINSIFVGNSDSGAAPDVRAFSDELHELVVEHSLIGDTAASAITATTGTGNILNQPALLGPLADNGGPTLTHALLPGSVAIDAGNNALAVDDDNAPLSTDQRGVGFDRVSGSSIDIGAFEVQDSTTAPPTIALATANEGGVLALAGAHDLRDDVFGSDF